MESIKWDIELNEQQKEYRRQCIAFCKQDPDVLRFLEEHDLDSSFIDNHSSVLKKWSENTKICQKCEGLHECCFDHGKSLEITMDGEFLIQVYRKCRYLKEEEERNQYLKNYRMFHGNKEMMTREFSTVDMSRSDSKEMLLISKALMQNEHEDKGIYLYGKPGCGKTYLMNCLAHSYVKKGYSVSFVNVATLISELKNGFTVSGLIEEVMKKLKNSDVLILDDIGGESLTGWSRDEILMPLLNERMEKRMKTYFTSNYSYEELENHFSIDSRGNVDKIKANRLMERIMALTVEKNLKGVNRRR